MPEPGCSYDVANFVTKEVRHAVTSSHRPPRSRSSWRWWAPSRCVVTASPADAAGTVTVAVQGRGDVTGDGRQLLESGGSDCSQFYANERVCGPDARRRASSHPSVTLTAGPDRIGFAFYGLPELRRT